MVVLLHKADARDSVLLTHTLSRLAENVVLWKPRTAHTARSSFYLVAKGVRPGCVAARAAVEGWKMQWRVATFGGGEVGGGALKEGGEETVKGVLREFGGELVRMVEPVFKVQVEALRRAPWMKGMGGGGKVGL